MSDTINYSSLLRTVFQNCVESVKPKSLLNTKKIELVSSSNAIRIGDEFIGAYT